jgi:diguanylate cyclase (GGDEF)-like protein/PAS domain S-box-containing protein
VIVHGAIFVRKGNANMDPAKIRSESDLAGKSLIVLNSDLVHDYALARGWGKQLVLVPTAADGMRLLASGQHDALLLSKLVGMQTLQAQRLTNIVALVPKLGLPQKFSFAVHKGQPDLLYTLNEGLAMIKSSGTYDMLYNRWFSLFDVKEVGWRDLLPYLLPVATIFVLIGIYFWRRQKAERKQAAATIAQSRDLLITIINTIPVRVFWKDRNLCYLGCNTAFAEDAGCTHAGEIIGKNDYELVWSAQADMYRREDHAVIATGAAKLFYEKALIGPGGQTSWLRVSKIPLRNTENDIIGVLGVYEDITERKRLKEIMRDAQQYARSLIEASRDPLIMIDREGKITDVNTATEKVTGVPRDDLIGSDFVSYLTDPEQGRKSLQSVYLDGSEANCLLVVRHVSGSLRDFLFNANVYRDANDKVQGALVAGRDITERIKAEEKLRQLSIAVEQSSAAIDITDLDGNVEYVNPRFTEVTGYTQADAIGKNLRILKSMVTPAATYIDMWNKLTNGLPWHGELLNKRKNGDLYWEESHIAPVMNGQGKTTHYVAVKTDITVRKQLEEQVLKIAFYDPLTMLPNRRLLNDRLTQAMAISKRSGRFGALLFLDLDHFKALNDGHGHDAGDFLLQEVANRLKSCVRETDTVSRMGGDEFIVLLGDLSDDKIRAIDLASNIAEKIRTVLSVPYLLTITDDKKQDAEVEHCCTASIGVMLFVGQDSTQAVILNRADKAMYLAKKDGGNRVRISDIDACSDLLAH